MEATDDACMGPQKGTSFYLFDLLECSIRAIKQMTNVEKTPNICITEKNRWIITYKTVTQRRFSNSYVTLEIFPFHY